MSRSDARYTAQDLRAIADDRGPFFSGNARQALKWAASTLDAARDAVEAERLRTEATAAELRRLSAVDAERDRFSSESAQHFIRAREWAERAGQMEAERDALAAELERVKSAALAALAVLHPETDEYAGLAAAIGKGGE